jgi:hypothetical protein
VADKIDPSAARLLELHAGVIGGDRAALEQLADELWLPLCGRLRRSFPRAATDLIADASNDAILTYAARPHEFDVSRRCRSIASCMGSPHASCAIGFARIHGAMCASATTPSTSNCRRSCKTA